MHLFLKLKYNLTQDIIPVTKHYDINRHILFKLVFQNKYFIHFNK